MGPLVDVKALRYAEQPIQRELPAPSSHAGPLAGGLWIAIWSVAAALAVAGVVKHRARLRAQTRARSLEDRDVHRIIATGVYTSNVDEPTDLSRVEEEERRFWAQVQASDGEEPLDIHEPRDEERAPWDASAEKPD